MKNNFTKTFSKRSLVALLLCVFTASRVFAQCPGQTLGATIITNTTWTTNATIDHNIEVTTGVTLTMQTATFSFIPNAKITVDYGAHLVLNGAILTHNCTGLWRGIVIIGDSTADQDDAMSSITIEGGSQINYAKIGVLLGDSTDSAGGGAILTMTSSSINNCREGVIFLSYPDSNTSSFVSSRFTASVLLPGYDSACTDVCLSLIQVHGIIIAGCSFINTVSDSLLSKVNGGGTGVSGKNAGYSLYPLIFIPVGTLTKTHVNAVQGLLIQFTVLA